MTNDPKQAKTILGWLPQSPLSPSPAAQPAEGTAPNPGAAQPGHWQGGYPPAGAPGPSPQGFTPAGSPGLPGVQPSHGVAPGYQGAQPPGGYPNAQPSHNPYGAQPGYPAAQPQGGYGTQPTPGFPNAQAGYPGAQAHAPGTQPAAGAPGYGAGQQPGFGQAAGQQPGFGQAAFGAAAGAFGVGGFAGAAQNAIGGAFSGPGGQGGAAAPATAASSQGSLREQANATEGVSDRTHFIRLTYLHLLGAILAFAGLEYLLMTNSFLIEKVSAPFVRFAIGGRWNWGVVLAVFMAVSWVADYWARHTTSRSLQYVGLGVYVVAEALIFVPLLAIVQWKTAAIIARGGGDPNIIRDAAFTTLAIFGALTASVFITKKDFSFLRTGLMLASAAAMMLVILSLVFGFNLGIVFSIAMVLLAAGYILFQTSQILAHYDPRNYVAAALALFSSVALMFWYVIRIFMRMRE